MSAWTRCPLRLRLALSAAVPVAATAGVAALMLEGGSLIWATVGVVMALAAGALTWVLSEPICRLANTAQQLANQQINHSDLPTFAGELAPIAHALFLQGERIQRLHESIQSDEAELARALAVLADSKTNPLPLRQTANFPESANRVKVAYDELCRQTLASRSRLNLSLRILQGLPDPVFAIDGDGGLRYLNPAAEKLFGVTNTSVLKKPFSSLLMSNPPQVHGIDPEPQVFGSAAIGEWLRRGTGGVRIAAGTDTRKRPFVLELSSPPTAPSRDAVICIVARDLSTVRQREAEERALIRANVIKQLLGRYLSESDDAIRTINAQARLLAADAKQSGQRDSMMPKLNTLRQSLSRMEIFADAASWMERFHWGQVPEPQPTEFKAIEVMNLVFDRLNARLRGRNNSVKFDDQGGWVFADAEWLETTMVGVLTHVCDSSENTAIEVRLRRLAAGENRPQPLLEFHIPDAGPALSASMLEAIDHPFGGRQSASLDCFDELGGFPMGLMVARRLVEAMGGELRLTNNASGALEVLVVLPTRVQVEGLTVSPTQVTEVAPFEETVAGWRLGYPTESINPTATRS